GGAQSDGVVGPEMLWGGVGTNLIAGSYPSLFENTAKAPSRIALPHPIREHPKLPVEQLTQHSGSATAVRINRHISHSRWKRRQILLNIQAPKVFIEGLTGAEGERIRQGVGYVDPACWKG